MKGKNLQDLMIALVWGEDVFQSLMFEVLS